MGCKGSRVQISALRPVKTRTSVASKNWKKRLVTVRVIVRRPESICSLVRVEDVSRGARLLDAWWPASAFDADGVEKSRQPKFAPDVCINGGCFNALLAETVRRRIKMPQIRDRLAKTLLNKATVITRAVFGRQSFLRASHRRPPRGGAEPRNPDDRWQPRAGLYNWTKGQLAPAVAESPFARSTAVTRDRTAGGNLSQHPRQYFHVSRRHGPKPCAHDRWA